MRESERELRGHIVLCTLEALGVRTLEELGRFGEHVVVVADNIEPRYREIAEGLGVTIVEGNQRDPECLRKAGITHARAVVLTADDDTGNIHAALTAHNLNPDIHIVLRTFDDDFARRVESLFPDAVAMSASALAAPGFITAILDQDANERWIDVLGRTLALRYTEIAHPDVVVPLADDATTPVALFPRDGARVLCLVDPTGGPAHTLSAKPAGRTGALPRPPSMGWLRRVDSRFWVLGAVLTIITLGSAVIFLGNAGQDLITAIYDVVGAFFGGVDPSVANTSGLRIFAIFLTLAGAAALAAFYALIADVVLSTRISNLLGPQATDAKDHVIVVGLDTIGYRIALLLHQRGLPVVVAEKDTEGRFVDATRQQHIAVVATDGRGPQALKKLRIDRARALVAVTSDDASNLATAMHARSLRPDLRIVLRLFDPDLAAQLDSALGDYNSRSVSSLAAPAFAAAAVGRRVLASIPIGRKRVLFVVRVPVEAGSAADGSTVGAEEVAASAGEGGGGRVLALVVGDEVRWVPGAADRISAGTELVIVAARRGMATAASRAARERSSHLALADDDEVGEAEGVEGRVLGGVEPPPENGAQPAMAGAQVVEAGVDHAVVHQAHGQAAEE